MIKEELYGPCCDAAERLYKQFCDPEKGFYAGCVKNKITGRPIHIFNQYPGVHKFIETKLNRKLTKIETTVLSIAIGEGPTPILSEDERTEIMQCVFPCGKAQYQKKFIDIMRLMTVI